MSDDEFDPIPETEEEERAWDELFAKSHDMLRKMAEKALEEHRAGRTVDLDKFFEDEDNDEPT